MTLANIAHTLRYLGAPRSFAVRRFASAKGLLFGVQRLGKIALPIDAATATQLIAQAKPSRFGLREATLRDPNVRRSWEIDAKRLRLGSDWTQLLHAEVAAMREELQLPRASNLKVELDKLLIYEQGHFFLPHQDSEKCEGMIGTLVVVLPSDYAGGDVVIEHQGQRVEFRRLKRADTDLTLLAFYADCRHEVKPVARGHRVALTFRLVVEAGATEFVSGTSPATLQEAVRNHFERPPPRRFESDVRPPPDRLVYLLDHQYTQKGLSWSRLKGTDRARARALQHAGETLDCHVCLALADVHEVWGCQEQDWGRAYRRGYGYRGSYDHGASDSRDPSERKLEDLQVSEVELVYSVGSKGEPAGLEGWVASGELCCTTESVTLKPYKANYEPYMGNYGNTVDRWYHRAAVVLWPRARDFKIRAEASTAWALQEIQRQIEAEHLDLARRLSGELAQLMTPGGSGRAQLLVEAMRIAVGIADRTLALELLARFDFNALGQGSGRGLRELLRCYGAPFGRSLFERWQGEQRPGWKGEPVAALAEVVAELCEGPLPKGADKLARQLVERQWAALKPNVSEPPEPAYPKQRVRYASPLVDLLVVCEITENAKVRNDVMRTLQSAKAGFSADELVRLAGEMEKGPRAKVLSSVRIALLDHAAAALRAALAKPERKRGDWSLQVDLSCNCELCKALSRFLRSAGESRLLWPLSKERRAHVHGMIERHALPMDHTTHRQGSPHTLVLTKRGDLREREATERKAGEKLLRQLESIARAR